MLEEVSKFGSFRFVLRKSNIKKKTTVYLLVDIKTKVEQVKYDFDIIAARMRELAFLNKGITITLSDLRDLDDEGVAAVTTYHSEGGLREFAQYLDRNREALISDVIYFEGEREIVKTFVQF